MTSPRGLSIRDLQARLGNFRLGPLSLEAPPAACVVLLGPSGCGKTSLLKTLCGIQPAWCGRIELNGRDLTRLPPERRGIGYVPQTSALFPHLNVRDNIQFGLHRSRRHRQETQLFLGTLCQHIGVTHLLRRAPRTLSGGESRRVALARSLACRPDLMLLDEPLSMLDPNARAEMLATILRIHAETRTTIVHVTHDRDEASALGGICAVMRNGRIEQTGSFDTLLDSPRTAFTALFLGCGTVLPARFTRDHGRPAARIGRYEWPVREPIPASGHGHLLLRPGAWALGPRPGVAGMTVEGILTHCRSHGAYTRLRIRTPDLGELPVELPGAPPHLPKTGETIAIHPAAPFEPLEDPLP